MTIAEGGVWCAWCGTPREDVGRFRRPYDGACCSPVYGWEQTSQHPLPAGTQARVCDVEHGWLFGTVVSATKQSIGWLYEVRDNRKEITVHEHSFRIQVNQQGKP
jgi:hypothetical protein